MIFKRRSEEKRARENAELEARWAEFWQALESAKCGPGCDCRQGQLPFGKD